MFQIITYFSITYNCLPNMCLYHLHRKQWLPSLVLSRSSSAVRSTSKCQQAAHSQQSAKGSSPEYSQAPPTPNSRAQCLNPEGCCLVPLHLKHWGRRVFPVTSWAHRQPLDHFLLLCFCQGSDLQGLCASCSGLLTSYPGGSLGSAQLGNWY